MKPRLLKNYFSIANIIVGKSKALDISKATVTNVDGSALETLPNIGPLLLGGIIVTNCKFDGFVLVDVDFKFATLSNVSFSSGRLSRVNFTIATLRDVNFSYASLGNVDVSLFPSSHPSFHYCSSSN